MTLYFITCFYTDDNHDIILSDGRTFGYEETYEEAKFDLEKNMCDIHECLYTNAVIEEVEGNTMECKNRTWFAYDFKKEGFFETKKPDFDTSVVKLFIKN